VPKASPLYVIASSNYWSHAIKNNRLAAPLTFRRQAGRRGEVHSLVESQPKSQRILVLWYVELVDRTRGVPRS